MKKGEVTAFLSLIFILLMSVVASVIESASIQGMKNRRRGDMDAALESVFAEYQREMLKEYDVFTLEGTYETGSFSEARVLERLSLYGMRDTEHEVTKIQFLTDDNGRAFREQVIAYMKQKMGIDAIEELTQMTDKWEEQNEKGNRYEEEGTDIGSSLDASLSEQELELPKEDNPIEVIETVKKSGLLNVVMKNGPPISTKAVPSGELLTNRSLRRGWGSFKIRQDTTDVMSNAYFTSYLLEKFSAADKPNEGGKLSYELEYILNGEASDRENLEKTVEKLVGIRFAANYGYLLTDAGKKAEAQAMALALASIIAFPAITEIIKQAILLAWAFGESIMDLRSLLGGGKVSLVKTGVEWQLSLGNLLKLGTAEDKNDGNRLEKGLSYKEYLKMLLLLEKQEVCTMRSLGVVEMRMQASGKGFFKADNCIGKIAVRSRCNLRRNISYKFVTEYGYQ